MYYFYQFQVISGTAVSFSQGIRKKKKKLNQTVTKPSHKPFMHNASYLFF